MNHLRIKLSILAICAAVASSQATISNVTEYCAAAAYQYDNGYYVNDVVLTGPFVFSSPFSTHTSGNGATMRSLSNSNLNYDATSSSYIHRSGSFSGFSAILAAGTGQAQVAAYMYDELVFDVDVSTSVTISASGTVTASSGVGTANNYIYIDGTLASAAVDGTYSMNVGAGNHVVYFEGVVVDNYAVGSAKLRADYDMKIGSVPEPASMSVVGVGLIGLLRRRRSAK